MMPLTRNASREDLHADILTTLGAPAIRIEVTPAQIDQAINAALKQFWKHHRSGSYEDHMVLKVTQADVDAGYLMVPLPVDQVIEVLPKGYTLNQANFANFEWQLSAAAMASAGGMGTGTFSAPGTGPGGSFGGNTYADIRGQYSQISLADYMLAKQQIDYLRRMTGADTRSFTYVRYQRRLIPLFPYKVDDMVVMKVSINVDPESADANVAAMSTGVWDDEWLKAYAVAQVKIVWGGILRKHGQVALPGGVLLDGQTVIQEGNDEANALLDELAHEQPIDFLIG